MIGKKGTVPVPSGAGAGLRPVPSQHAALKRSHTCHRVMLNLDGDMFPDAANRGMILPFIC
eukprot:scaffold55587_cov19-Prasinocladus_malaysianus.AAC.1